MNPSPRFRTYLNLGCGGRFHPEWTNVDLFSRHPSVISSDLRKGVPFDDRRFEVVYHSHVLEHFSRQFAGVFLEECRRVLKTGGIIRMAVPDLEQIVRTYLCCLDGALRGQVSALEDYEWIVLELYDQVVRQQPGGDMARYFQNGTPANVDFVLRRLGTEARCLMEAPCAVADKAQISTLREKLRRRLANTPTRMKELLTRLLLGPDYGLLLNGRFRHRGEVHLWMYDRHSLATELKKAGFENPVVRSADESCITSWSSFHLDTEPDGTVYKPDSLFMEAFRP